MSFAEKLIFKNVRHFFGPSQRNDPKSLGFCIIFVVFAKVLVIAVHVLFPYLGFNHESTEPPMDSTTTTLPINPKFKQAQSMA